MLTLRLSLVRMVLRKCKRLCSNTFAPFDAQPIEYFGYTNCHYKRVLEGTFLVSDQELWRKTLNWISLNFIGFFRKRARNESIKNEMSSLKLRFDGHAIWFRNPVKIFNEKSAFSKEAMTVSRKANLWAYRESLTSIFLCVFQVEVESEIQTESFNLFQCFSPRNSV